MGKKENTAQHSTTQHNTEYRAVHHSTMSVPQPPYPPEAAVTAQRGVVHDVHPPPYDIPAAAALAGVRHLSQTRTCQQDNRAAVYDMI